MSEPSIDPTSADDDSRGEGSPPAIADHADKYNDPRAKITPRGVWMGVAVIILGIVGAFGSIYARKTKLGESTRFWGEDTITALQLGERIELLPAGGSDFPPVELTATPGLGHLRRALLDERNYQWDTETNRPALENCRKPNADQKPNADLHPNADLAEPEGFTHCIRLRLTDPTAHRFDTVEIDIDLGGGWIGPSDGSRRVQATPHVQPKLRNYIGTIVNVEQLRYDLRD